MAFIRNAALPIFALRPVLHRHPILLGSCALLLVCSSAIRIQAAASNSVARVWSERAIAAIRVDTPHPPAQARNLFSLSVCMYDAWAAYDTNGAIGCTYHAKYSASDITAAR